MMDRPSWNLDLLLTQRPGRSLKSTQITWSKNTSARCRKQSQCASRAILSSLLLRSSKTQSEHRPSSRAIFLGPELAARCDAGSLADRFNHLIKLFDGQPEHRLADGSLLGDELVLKAVSLLPPGETPAPWRKAPEPSPPIAALLRALDRDGFTVIDGVLRRALPASLKLSEAEDEISRLLTKHGFVVAKGHLDQAFAAHTEGRWASANSQVRSFFDALTDQIAERMDPSSAALPSGHGRRSKLAGLGFLSRDLNEWDDNGNAYINGLVKRLHPHGSHPGLSDQDDSTFRLHTVLLAARLFLVRFDERGSR
jgi:hypothetical protein